MNLIFGQQLSFLLSLAALTVLGSGLSAQAETINTISTDVSAQPSINEVSPNQIGSASLSVESSATATQAPVATNETAVVEPLARAIPQETMGQGNNQGNLQAAAPVVNQLNNATKLQQLEQITPTQEAASSASAPIPGTTTTSATALASQGVEPATETAELRVAQIIEDDDEIDVENDEIDVENDEIDVENDEIDVENDEDIDVDVDVDPGQATRGVPSYIGVAGNIGVGGDAAIGETSFAVISKIGLTNTFSTRPTVAIETDPVILIPLTYDFNIQPTDAFDVTLPIRPYAGAGVAIETSDDPSVGLVLTGGVDVPINENLTATAAVNATFLDETGVGILLGVGYNFPGLFGR